MPKKPGEHYYGPSLTVSVGKHGALWQAGLYDNALGKPVEVAKDRSLDCVLTKLSTSYDIHLQSSQN
jgi:hypothetical protein